MNIRQNAANFNPISDADLKALVETHTRDKIIATLQALSLPIESLSKRSQEERRAIRDYLEPPLPLEREPKFSNDIHATSDHPEASQRASGLPIETKSEPEPAKSEFHKAALDYIKKGYRIIPMVPGQKTPMMKQWHANALETAEQADEFFAAHSDCNIGFCPEDMGLMVIDADTYRGEACDVARLEIPETFEVESPRGGTHYYLAGTAPPTSGKEGKYLGPYIDTRGRGSYVLLPPSVVDGKRYRVKADRDIAALPIEIEERLARQEAPAPATETRLDLPGNVSAARTRLADLVKAGKVSIAGQFGHDTCYEIACELVRDLGLSPDTALELLLAEWYPHCTPNNNPSFVSERVLSAARNGQNAIGAHATAPAAEVFADAELVPSPPTQPKAAEAAGKYRLMTLRDIWNMADPEPLIDGLLVQRENTSWYGPKKLGKSFLALDASLAVAANVRVFGNLAVHLAGPVIYFTSEGKAGFKKRIKGWAQEHGFADFDKFMDDVPFYFYPVVPNAATFAADCQTFYEQVVKQIGRKPVLVVIDTMAKSMRGLNENDNSHMELYLAMCESLIDKLDCTSLTIAHTGKDESKEIRGASASGGGFDAIWRVEGDRKSKTLRISGEDMKDSSNEAAYHFRLKPVTASGMEYGQTMVPAPISAEQYKSGAVTGSSKPNWQALIEEALLEGGRTSWNTAIRSTADLAVELCIKQFGPAPERGSEASQQWHTERAAIQKRLDDGSRARGNAMRARFADYCDRRVANDTGTNDTVLRWFIQPHLATRLRAAGVEVPEAEARK